MLVITSDHGVAVSAHATQKDAKMYLASCIMDWLINDHTVSSEDTRQIVNLGLEGSANSVVDVYFSKTRECAYELLDFTRVGVTRVHAAEDLIREAHRAKRALVDDGWWT